MPGTKIDLVKQWVKDLEKKISRGKEEIKTQKRRHRVSILFVWNDEIVSD